MSQSSSRMRSRTTGIRTNALSAYGRISRNAALTGSEANSTNTSLYGTASQQKQNPLTSIVSSGPWEQQADHRSSEIIMANSIPIQKSSCSPEHHPQATDADACREWLAAWAAIRRKRQKVINSLVRRAVDHACAPTAAAPKLRANPTLRWRIKLFHWTLLIFLHRIQRTDLTRNINVLDRPIVQNPDGSSSTVRSRAMGMIAESILFPQ